MESLLGVRPAKTLSPLRLPFPMLPPPEVRPILLLAPPPSPAVSALRPLEGLLPPPSSTPPALGVPLVGRRERGASSPPESLSLELLLRADRRLDGAGLGVSESSLL